MTSFAVDEPTLIAIRGLSAIFGASTDAAVIRKSLALARVAADHAVERDGQWLVQIVRRDGSIADVSLNT